MNAQEAVAWAAGLIEGEGSIQVVHPSSISTHTGLPRPKFLLRVVMTDRDFLERLREVFGCGVVLPYKNLYELGKKQLYRWDAGKYEKVKDVCLAIRPFMSERRTGQIDRLLQAMETTRQSPTLSPSVVHR